MEQLHVTDQLSQQAIAAIDEGNIVALIDLIGKHPQFVRQRLQNEEEGYFKNPYLLWFVADNPIRNGKLPEHILAVISELITLIKTHSPGNWQHQIDYALELIASGNNARESGLQTAMMKLLLDAGASPECAMTALTNGNTGAAEYLLAHGAKLNLALAVCLNRQNDIEQLLESAATGERLAALAAAAFYGKADKIKYLLGHGVNPNGYAEESGGFHNHATPLHHAVSSGSMESVKLLVEAGAEQHAHDKLFNGTPLEWAEYLKRNAETDEQQQTYLRIEAYLSALK